MTDPFDTVRIPLEPIRYFNGWVEQRRDALAALASIEERLSLERYRVDVLLKEVEAAERERDEALHAEEVAEQYREKAEARVVELEELLASLKVCRP